MGEVWLARDVRLGRRVALKFLPPEVTRDPARLARFEHEARAASALNHPGVCTILALEDTPDGQRYIAMEYVAGATLRERINTSRIPLHEALDAAIQIAAAVSAAHAAGLVHRDIKPENVMLRADGLVKIVDFGLAKLTAASNFDPGLATQTSFRTDPGSVVGTVAYMSPEQATGQPVDARSDIWALGVVLYEMLAGRSPFSAPSNSETLAAILDRDPAPLARVEPAVPSELQRIVTKALRKERDRRYQTIGDLLLDLKALRDELQREPQTVVDVEHHPDAPQKAPATQTRPRYRDRRRLVLISLAAAIAVAAGAAWFWSRSRVSTTSAARPAVHGASARDLSRLTSGPGLQTDVTWSPDGQSIAFASDRSGNFDIWVQRVAGGDAVQVTRSGAPDTQPAWSPDGSNISFRSERQGGGLYVVPSAGGPERQLTTFGVFPQWTPDGAEIIFRTGLAATDALHAVPAAGGATSREILQPFLRGGAWFWIAVHPDSRISAFGLHPKMGLGFFTVGRDGQRVIRSELADSLPLRLGNAQQSRLGTRIGRFQWNSTGTALYVEGIVNEVQNVWRIEVDRATLRWVSGERLTTGAGTDARPAVSHDDRRLAFTTEQRASRLWVYPLDEATGFVKSHGAALTAVDEGTVQGSDLAPDGSRVAYVVKRPGSVESEFWSVKLDGSGRELIAKNAVEGVWASDSQTIAYSLFRASRGEWALAVRTWGGPERLLSPWSDRFVMLPTSWTPDQSAVLGSYMAPRSAPAALAVWPASGVSSGPQRVVMAVPNASFWQGRFSPDGRWLAFVLQKNGVSGVELFVARARGSDPQKWTRVAPDHDLADKPRWSKDGKTLYFLSRQRADVPLDVWRVPFDGEHGLAGKPFRVTQFNSPSEIISSDVGTTEIGIAPQSVVLTMETATGSIWMLDNVGR
jgi:eukaryotic-like serine/threonine-protein kinase